MEAAAKLCAVGWTLWILAGWYSWTDVVIMLMMLGHIYHPHGVVYAVPARAEGIQQGLSHWGFSVTALG